MSGLLQRLRKKIVTSSRADRKQEAEVKDIDSKITLGVLLWAVGAVAQADDKFLKVEEDQIKKVISSHLKLSQDDLAVILTTVRQAAMEKIDFFQLVREANGVLAYSEKVSIIKDLLRIACADRILDDSEIEIIEKMALLLEIEKTDFAQSMREVKREFGLDSTN